MLELQDIFRQYGADYRNRHVLSPVQSKAMDAILTCRTGAQGAHVDRCDECGFEKISYNSCRNRHCPKCQTFAKEDWIDQQKEYLLDRPYFHVVFTVPAELRPVFFHNQEKLYSLLFKATSETLLELCADRKYLGAKPGITAVLHTWGQNLTYHPHLHCIVTGGGLTNLGNWQDSRKKFFIPVKVLSKKFKGKLLYYLKQAAVQFDSSLYHDKWVVYCKPPFGNAQKVIDYLGRYTHRVAISNHRLIESKDGYVSFKWKDYSDGNKQKTMTLTADEFIRRFLTHVLPKGFRKIRHFGLLASRDKRKRLTLCKRLTHTRFIAKLESVIERLERIFGSEFNLCPRCQSGRMARASPNSKN